MPIRPRRPCANPRCTNLTTATRCEGCERKRRQRINREIDAKRPSAAERGYDGKWRRYCRRFLREHPFCECDECRASGRPMASEVVDHVVPHRGDKRLFWDRTNHQAMSKLHHDRKTATEDMERDENARWKRREW